MKVLFIDSFSWITKNLRFSCILGLFIIIFSSVFSVIKSFEIQELRSKVTDLESKLIKANENTDRLKSEYDKSLERVNMENRQYLLKMESSIKKE